MNLGRLCQIILKSDKEISGLIGPVSATCDLRMSHGTAFRSLKYKGLKMEIFRYPVLKEKRKQTDVVSVSRHIHGHHISLLSFLL